MTANAMSIITECGGWLCVGTYLNENAGGRAGGREGA